MIAGAVSTARILREGHERATEIAARALAEAERSELGAFWALDGEGATRTAARVDERLVRGKDAGLLAGVTVAVKDLFDLAGLPTTGGVRSDLAPARGDAAIVRRFRRAGAVPLGKSSMDQLGWSVAGTTPGFPPCINPLSHRLSPGGSSSGSAVAVAAGITGIGIGADIAGSVRIPAAFCGLVGLRLAPRRVSLQGALRIVPSFDAAGVLAVSVRDCVAAYEVLTGRPAPPRPTETLRLGLLEDLFEAADSDVASAAERAARRAGAGDLVLASTRLCWQPRGFGRILAAELARTWGARVKRSPGRFTDDIRRSVKYGDRLSGASEAEARMALGAARQRLRRRLAGFDVLGCPTVPCPVPPADRRGTVDEITRFTRLFSALGWPAVSLPAGLDSAGRPVGLQLAAPPSKLGQLLHTAAVLEQ
jgi:Asp-tRNA(Asn)/Glu-tRNA(Gln) amidotransferase A subunit family amidase